MNDTRTDRERISAMARAAAALPEPYRRRAVMGLLRERYRQRLPAEGATVMHAEQPPCCSEAEVFYDAYGDETGREYWAAWLFPGKVAPVELARLLAAHISRGVQEFEHVRMALSAALTETGGISACAIVGRLLEDPDTRRFVPASLRAYHANENSSVPDKQPITRSASRRRGQKPLLRDLVLKSMREVQMEGIDVVDMKEEAMAEMFKASRKTCRAARELLVAAGS